MLEARPATRRDVDVNGDFVTVGVNIAKLPLEHRFFLGALQQSPHWKFENNFQVLF